MADRAAAASETDDREAGLRSVQREAAWSNLTSTVTTGAILGAFAVHMGASNFAIGLLAAAPFLTQLLQLPTVLLIERTRRRRLISVASSVVGRSGLLVIAALAFLPGNSGAIAGVVAMQFLFCAAGAVGGCAWNAWMRDLIPETRLGDVMARRTRRGAIVGMIAGLAAAIALDRMAENPLGVAATYAALYFCGFAAGMVSAFIVARIPESPMVSVPHDTRIGPMLRAPLKDKNFRRVMMFLGSWQFAVNLASPFFTVYLLRQLGFDITTVMLVSMVGQFANILTLRGWGALADRYSNKSVLGFAAPLFLLCIAGFAGASQIRMGWGLIAYLVGLHALMGACSAGVTLATANIVLKLSPRGESAAWLATSALATASAAGLAAILGGAFAEFFASRELELLLRWTNPDGVLTLTPLRLSNWDFYFLLAALLGLFALHRLALVKESGEIDRKAFVEHVVLSTRRTLRDVSTAASTVIDIPGALIREAAAQARLGRLRDSKAQSDTSKLD
jgi:MFS family permease